MDQKTWDIALDVYDTLGDLEPKDFINKLDTLDVSQEVKELLKDIKKSEEDASDYFDNLEVKIDHFLEPPIPEKLGAWKIKNLLDTGGMSSVHLAERWDDNFEMKAAVKFIQYAGFNPKVRLRFRREMQFLASLDHPNITRIIDSGITEHGTPWYMMEYVDGIPITEYCNKHKLNLKQRLQLFRDVCQAVQHAHKKLIVHRDLKPSNIFVDSEGRVKLLDFGIGKALSDSKKDNTANITQLNRALMTPNYASPEQLEGKNVSTSTDVYSLGIILHELITGTRPYSFDDATPVQMVRILRDTLPENPSKVFASGQEKPAGIQQKTISKDLDDIILTALRFDPDRRYQSVEQFGRDVGNYLNDEPVMARADSKGYRAKKFIQRNKTAVVLSVLSLIILLASSTAIFWQSKIIAAERDVAQTEAALSDAVREHLMFLFREAGNLGDDAEQMSARELLDRSAQVAGDWLQDDPSVQNHVMAVLGEISLALNDYSAAESILEKVVESEHAKDDPFLRAGIYRDMAQVHHRRGNLEDGFALVDDAVEILEVSPGDHRARLADILQVRGRLHRDLGRREAAIADLERARELAYETSEIPRPLLARAESNLGTTLMMYGNLDAAKNHYERADEIWHELGRPESTEALSVMNNLAAVYNNLGQPEQAKNMFRQVVDLRYKNYGESGSLAAAMLHLGRILITYGEFEEAASLINDSVDMTARFVGETSPNYGATIIGLGELYRAQGNFDRAYSYFEDANSLFRENFGPQHPHTYLSAVEMVNTLREKHGVIEHDRYQNIIDRGLEMGPSANMVLSGVYCQAAKNAIMLKNFSLSKNLSTECLELRNNLGLGGWRIIEPNALLALTNLLEGEPEAEEELRTEIGRLSDWVSDQHPALIWIRSHANLKFTY